MPKIKPLSPGLLFYTGKIRAGVPFSFVRYGNGEWDCITQARKRTGSGSHFLHTPRLRSEMANSIILCPEASNYIPALRGTSLHPRILRWLLENQPKHMTWHDCTVFYKHSRHGRLFPLVDALRKSPLPVVLIGPPHLGKFAKRIAPVLKHIIIPTRDCYTKKKNIIRAIMSVSTPALFAFSAGPATKPFIHHLYGRIGKESSLIDFGSVWDVYCGEKSRKYHKKITKAQIRKNLTGK